jgi:hypothetical protein
MKWTFKRALAAAFLLPALAITAAWAADSYTTSLRIVQMPTGSNDSQWGTKANAAFAMLDQAIAGSVSISVTGGNVTLSTANNATDQARNALITFTGTPGTTRTITMPNVSKLTYIRNASDSTLVFTAGAGTTASIVAGDGALIYTDGSTNAVALADVSPFGQTITNSVNAAAVRTIMGVSVTGGDTTYAFRANNLSDLTNAGTARTNIGAVGTARAINTGTGLSGGGDLSADRTISLANTAVVPGTYTEANIAIDQQGRITSASSGSVSLLKASNLSDLTSASTARANLSLGTAALQNVGAFLQPGNNLADVSSPSAAFTNLGGGTMGKVTENVSTSGPSGTPNAGDIWIQY